MVLKDKKATKDDKVVIFINLLAMMSRAIVLAIELKAFTFQEGFP